MSKPPGFVKNRGTLIPVNKVLCLDHHCIETEIRRLYNRALSAYFKESGPSAKKRLEEQIDFYHHALETLDFARLRSRYPALSGHSNAHVILSSGEAHHRLMITIDGESFHADSIS